VSLPYTSSLSGVVVASHVGTIALFGSVVSAIVHVPNFVLVVGQPMPERIREAYDFMASFGSKLTTMLDMEIEEILARQLRMTESSPSGDQRPLWRSLRRARIPASLARICSAG
jgi:hypothetical protein